MAHLLRSLLAVLGLGMAIATALPASAQMQLSGNNHVNASLIAESSAPKPGGSTELAIYMQPEKGWHGYWENPGDAGLGMSLKWSLPSGASVEKLRYPVPDTLVIAGLMNHVYEGEHAPLITLRIAPGVPVGTVMRISAEAEWLACSDEVCVPESATITTTVTVGTGAVDPSQKNRFDDWRRLIPAPLASGARFEIDEQRFRMAIPFPRTMSLDDPHFFIRSNGVLRYSADQVFSRQGDVLLMETELAGAPSGPVSGVLKMDDSNGIELTAARGEVALPSPTDQPTAEKGGLIALLLTAIAGAVLGGLLLNVMPCVFPILSLKALSLARAGGDERRARQDAMAYSFGVVVTCIGLGIAMLALRAGGEEIGWAFQLQEPRIIFALLLLVTAMAFNLAGLFEFSALTAGGSLASRGGAAGSFWTGALAAFVATPCTAPFMAAAMGSALILPAPAALLVFAGLGLGLAMPFLAIGFFPGLRRILPRPGPWMEIFRKLMAVPMFLTATALIWLLGQQSGTDAMAFGALGVLLMTLGLWWAGQKQGLGSSAKLPFTLAVLISVAATGFAPLEVATSRTQNAAKAGEILPSESFSISRLAQLRSSRTPVFVYFTADWCITCKANEATAIQRQKTADAFRKEGVVVLKGDWTTRDPEITRFLGLHARSGVPLYIWYEPGKDPRILPQVLSSQALIRLARR